MDFFLLWKLLCSILYSVTDRQTDCWVGGYWKVGPIPIDDSLGKEVVTRLITNLTSNKEFYTDSNGCDFLKQVKIWCFCFLLIRSSAVEKTFTVQVLDCFGWLQIGNLMPPSCYPDYLSLRNFWGLGVDLLGLICRCKIRGQAGDWTAKEPIAGNYYRVHTLLSAYILWV
jgi:hypothetical protein